MIQKNKLRKLEKNCCRRARNVRYSNQTRDRRRAKYKLKGDIMKTITVIERENNVSGKSRHGTIYPMFSSWARYDVLMHRDSENVEREICRKVTIEDGQFTLASRRKGYTGQHTDLFYDEQLTAPCNYVEVTNVTCLYGRIYSRNAYGGRLVYFRLDCINGTTQFKRGNKWYNFHPANYID